MKKIYLASPFFDATECHYYHRAIEALRSAGYEVYVPQEHSIEGGWEMPNEEWARRVFAEDVDAIRTSDVVMILNFGMYSDSGTAWEAGYAYALKIPTVQVLCGGANATYSLMMWLSSTMLPTGKNSLRKLVLMALFKSKGNGNIPLTFPIFFGIIITERKGDVIQCRKPINQEKWTLLAESSFHQACVMN